MGHKNPSKTDNVNDHQLARNSQICRAGRLNFNL